MNILLINTNPVVSRLISLCTREEDTVLEEVTDVSAVKRDTYDIVFIDDSSYVAEVEKLLQHLLLGKKIFLSGKNVSDDIVPMCDEVILKPFLPSQITAVLEGFNVLETDVTEENEKHFIFPLSTEESQLEDDTLELDEDEDLQIKESPEMILDSKEIDRIKALLEEDEDEVVLELEDETDYESRKVEVITEHLEADGLEIVNEDEIIDILSKKKKKKKSKKEKNQKKAKKSKEESYTFEEVLIAAIEDMKPKKIKKLLKDAEVTIKINFKDKK